MKRWQICEFLEQESRSSAHALAALWLWASVRWRRVRCPRRTGTLAIKDDKHDRPQSNTAGSSMVRRLSGWGYLHSRTDVGAGFRRGRMARVPRDMDCD